MKKILLIAISLIFVLTGNSYASNTHDTGIFVEGVFKDSIKIAKDDDLTEKQREDQLSNLISKSVDTNWIARFVIGKYWRQITEAQKKEFINLYQSYLIKTYVPRFQKYGGGEIKVNKIIKQKERVFFVQAEFDNEEGQAINIDFRIIKKNGELLITDIIAEGVSFIVTQRSEVNSSISNKGFENFLDHLREMQN